MNEDRPTSGDEAGAAGETAPANSWPRAKTREQASAFLDMWERHVSERARRGPAKSE